MRVAHISTVHFTFDQRIFYRECISLERSGFKVTLIIHHNDGNKIVQGINIVTLGNLYQGKPGFRIFSRLFKIYKALRIALQINADIYHLHDPELLCIVPFLKIFRRSKIIYDCHEDNVGYILHKQYIHLYLRKVLSLLFNFYERFAVLFLDAVITADPGVESHFRKICYKTETIYNFPRLDLFTLSSNANEPQFDLVYHGTLPKYHLEECFAIDDALVKHGMQVRWLFISRFTDKDWIEQSINARSANHRFTLQDRVPHDKVAVEVRKARIGIIPLPNLPKFQYNIPTKLFEFMALEMPVVMSDLPPSRPFVKDNDCAIMVPAHDYDAYAESIIELLNNSNKRIEMGKAGYAKVKSEYNWKHESIKLVDLYINLNDEGKKKRKE